VIVRLRLQRVPEEHQQVDLAVRDPGADLLVAAQRAAAEAGDGQAEILVEQAPGGAGGVQAVPGEDAAVEAGPLLEVLFPAVVCDKRDFPLPGLCLDGLIGGHPSSMRSRCCRDGTAALSRCV